MRLILLAAIMFLGAGLMINLVGRTGREIGRSRAEIAEEEYADLLLPDLQISPPKQMYIAYAPGIREIRFDTTFSNVGRGRLELLGEKDEERGITTAKQIIERKDGGREERLVGEFVFHPDHDHWHIEKYAQFQLWRYANTGEPTELVSSTDKFSFCLWDEHPYDLSLPGAPPTRQYQRCPRSNIQGNSIGWGDTYTPDTQGQELDIMGVPDGKYLVSSAVNVDNRILESNYANNVATLYVEISGNSLNVIDNF